MNRFICFKFYPFNCNSTFSMDIAVWQITNQLTPHNNHCPTDKNWQNIFAKTTENNHFNRRGLMTTKLKSKTHQFSRKGRYKKRNEEEGEKGKNTLPKISKKIFLQNRSLSNNNLRFPLLHSIILIEK